MGLGNSPKLHGKIIGDVKTVSVDLASIATVTIASATVTVPGVTFGGTIADSSVLVTPLAAFVAAGLLLMNAYPSAANEVTLVVYNPTGGPVDLGATNFVFNVLN